MPKRPSPLEEPPSASSSTSSSEEESEEVAAEREEDESEEESEEEEQQRLTQTTNAKPSLKKSKPNPTPTSSSAQPRTNSDSDDESDTESGSESDSEPSPEKPKPHRGADPSIKPISSKPMSSNAKPKKSSTSGTAAAATAPPSTPVKPGSSAAKRPVEVEKAEDLNQKKKKKKSGDAQEAGHAEESEKKQGEDPKKLFQRIWSEEDEIVILKGMLSFMKKELNPTANLDAFLDSIKGSLQIDVNKAQLHSKVQRLKQKYSNQVKRAKNGKEANFSKPHDLKVYQMSKKIWGRKGGSEDGSEMNNGVMDGKKSKSGKSGNGVVSPHSKGVSVPESHGENVDVEGEEKSFSFLQYGKGLSAPPPYFGDLLAKNGKLKEFEQSWNKLVADETKIYLRRLDLLREHAKAVLDMVEPSTS